jgi:hypothetical protein
MVVRLVLAAVAVGSISIAEAAVAPRIRGTPTAEVTAGSPYSFRPRAWDPDGDVLRFAVVNKPVWANFDATTGRLSGTPTSAQAGRYAGIRIRVNDGRYYRTLPEFAITVTATTVPQTVSTRKATYGHYFATRYEDTPADVAMLCGQPGVKGVVWRRTWGEVEQSPGVYDWSSYDAVLRAIAGSHNPQCQVWIFVEFKSFNVSPLRNPCPAYLRSEYSGPNADGGGAATCFMWEPAVYGAYARMMQAAAARYDGHPRVEGFILQESALGFNGAYTQDAGAGGTYTGAKWRDALVHLVQQCGSTWQRSRCLAFLNFIRNGQQYLNDVSRAIAAIPDNRGCMSGPDLLPDETSLHDGNDAVYQVLARHKGCRSNSAQNRSYGIERYNLDQVFNFAVRGNFGSFDQHTPRTSGVCVNSYMFWNHRVKTSWTGQNWLDALPVIAAYPYGRAWLDQCSRGGTAP